MQVATYQLEELGTGGLAFEGTDEVARGGHRVLLLYATHRHAKVLGFDVDSHAKRMLGIVDGVFDLGRQALLNLETARVGFHHTGNLAQTGDVAIGNIAHMRLADEGNQMVLA